MRSDTRHKSLRCRQPAPQTPHNHALSINVKANGEVLCNDDQGEQISLAMLDPEADTLGIAAFFDGEKFTHIRNAFAAGKVPWPGVCELCALLRPQEPFGADLFGQKVLQKIQLETSLACALKCPSCSSLAQLRSRKGSVHLSITLVTKLLTELNEAGFRIELIEFCGEGEPLNHPRFGELVSTIQRLCPQARLRLVTNGNHDYASKVGARLIHETIVSIDGVHQDSYAQYRVNGHVDRALAFLQDSVTAQRALGGSVIWKYILFTSNDDDSELLEAQRVADRIGVDRLWFVHGHGDMRSEKYTFQNARDFPVASHRVKLESHPSYNRLAHIWNNLGPGNCLSGAAGMVWLGNLVLHGNGTASLSGWINAATPAFDRVRIALNDGNWSEIVCDAARPDVIAAHPVFMHQLCGFNALIAAPAGTTGPLNLCFSLTADETEVSLLELTVPAHAEAAPVAAQDAFATEDS